MRIILLFLSVCYSAVIKVPNDYTTIQEGIDAAVEGDIVAVYPDTYYENIIVDKTITLTSLALFDTTTNTLKNALETWFSDDYPIVVTDDYINTTIIDGSTSNTRSPVIIDGNGECITPTVQGFTIQGGSGTEVDRYYEDPEGETVAVKQHLGGGIFTYKSNPKIYYNKIQNNGLESDIETGGAIYASSDTEDCDWSTRRSKIDEECDNDSFDFRYNFFENNDSKLGMHLSNRKFDGEFNLSGSVFDYWNCQNPEYQTKCWINIDEIEDLTADDYHSNSCLRSVPTYVDPDLGDDEFNDGSIDSPFKTIGKAIVSVAGSELAPITIHLAEGTYSPSINGEAFPINMISHINLIGQGEEVTIIDAEQTGRVITMEDCENNIISDLTITGGLAEGIHIWDYNDYGGGILLVHSSPSLLNLSINNNVGGSYGGGIYMSNSNSTLNNITIIHNEADFGGAMKLENNSSPIMTDMIIKNNFAERGAGMNLSYSSAIMRNVIINGNIAEYQGGGIYLSFSNLTLTQTMIIENNAENWGGGINLYHSDLISTNSVISNNMATQGGAIRMCCSSYITLANNIIWGNNIESIYVYYSIQLSATVILKEIQLGLEKVI